MMSFVLGDYLQWREFTVVISAITFGYMGPTDLKKAWANSSSLAARFFASGPACHSTRATDVLKWLIIICVGGCPAIVEGHPATPLASTH